MPPDTTVAVQRAALRAWLDRRYPGYEISWAETHVSILAFAGDRAWKLKKAVAYPFVDLSTRELRRRQCEREVALNRRLAPDVYLGVVALDEDSGRVIDHLVEMQRMPDDRRLAALATRGSQSVACLDRVADLIARFHVSAESGGLIDASATRDAVGALWDASFAELGPYAGAVVGQSAVDRAAVLARRYLAGRAPLFDARIAAGRARDGHGDLLADDIFCLSDGPRVLDCLEFDDHLRYGDALADVAFLAMDLERLGRADLARHVLDRYAEVAGDAWPESLEHLYIAYRAVVRAKVACLRADDGTAASSARHLLAMAQDHLESGRVRIVLIGGPPGTGKTTLANEVSHRLRWPVLHSDEIRKEIAGVPAAARDMAALDAGVYSREWDIKTYDELCSRARSCLERGASVVLDASWNGPDWRARAAQVAESTSSELVAFRCSIDPSVAADRVAARLSVGTDASDATSDLARTLSARFVDWPGATFVDTSARPEVVAASIVAALREPGTAAP